MVRRTGLTEVARSVAVPAPQALNDVLRRVAVPAPEWLAAAAIIVVVAWHVLAPGPVLLRLPFGWLRVAVTIEFLLGFAAGRVYLAQRQVLDRRAFVLLLVIALAVIELPRFLAIAIHARQIWQLLLPFAALAGGLVAVRVKSPARALTLVLVAQVLVVWAAIDLRMITGWVPLYDLDIYLAAGARALAGQPVYLDHAMVELPPTAGDNTFLYPPPLIPLLEVASVLPQAAVGVAWLVVLALSGFLAFRLLGLPRHWALLLLAFPPMVVGILVGNVVNLGFLLFAMGYRYRWPLVLGVFFKVQSLIPVAWLVREQRWRAVLIGTGVAVSLVLATLPLVGIESWKAWVASLGYLRETQVNLPIYFGESIAHVLSPLAFAAVGLAAVGAALLPRGRRGLAALGVATIVASPALWPHGFLLAIPAILGSRQSAVVWLALGLPTIYGPGLWAMTGLAVTALLVPGWGRGTVADPVHPLGGTNGPWPPEPASERARSVTPSWRWGRRRHPQDATALD
jgi:hypothetical protein